MDRKTNRMDPISRPHLARCIPLKFGELVLYNSGLWSPRRWNLLPLDLDLRIFHTLENGKVLGPLFGLRKPSRNQ